MSGKLMNGALKYASCRSWWSMAIVCGTLLSSLAGCDQQPKKTEPKGVTKVSTTEEEESAPKPDADAISKIALTEVDKEGYDAALAAFKGKVVLVDFWATWCPPCVKAFPHTVELSHKYGKQGLQVVSVSVDEMRDRDKAVAFLKKQGATFENWIAVGDAGEDHELEGVPTYKLYDKSGMLVREQAGAIGEDFEVTIRELLDQK